MQDSRFLEVPKELDLSGARNYCLHIPHGFSDQRDALVEQLVSVADEEGRSVELATEFAMQRRGWREWLRSQTCSNWLSIAGGVSEAEAEQIIGGFGLPVHSELRYNAGNPRKILSVAAAILRKPDIFIYTTAGCDPLGCQKIHAYIESQGCSCVAIHVSTPATHGDGSPFERICPPTTTCVEL